ncbi:melanophilin [Biomphalaria glabrata]
MGKKLNLTHLSEEEVNQIMGVIQKDFQVRREEKKKVSELQTELVKEQTKIQVLKERPEFNSTHCIICLETFGLLVRRKRSCYKCKVKVCSKCSVPRPKKSGQFVCPVCIKEKNFQILSNQWLYDSHNVSDKHFGSSQVVRYLYKKNSFSTSDTDADSGYLPSASNSTSAHRKHRPRLDEVFDIRMTDDSLTGK